MVAIVSGNSLGLGLTSLATLGQRGVDGAAAQGRSGELIYVNSSNGNLVLQSQDDRLVGRGPDLATLRTYNSQGQFNDDNGDNWSNGFYNQQLQLQGVRNQPDSKLIRTSRDGAQAVYVYDAGSGRYTCSEGGGAHDSIGFDAASNLYVWTDGDSGLTERYESTTAGRLVSCSDSSGQTVDYGYNAAGLLASMRNGSGEASYFDYDGTQLQRIRTLVEADASGPARTLTRVHYAYDSSNRLQTVTVDLSPEDNAIGDGRTYQTSYTYDGSSKRVASISQTDGTFVSIGYTEIDGAWRVSSVRDGLGHLTTYTYEGSFATTDVDLVANPAALSTVEQQSTTHALKTNLLTTPAVGYSNPALREDLNTASASSPQIRLDAVGGGLAVWVLGADLYSSTYNQNNDTWGAATKLDGALTGDPSSVHLSVSANGNALVTWIQGGNVHARRSIGGVWDGTSTIPVLENVEASPARPIGSINDSGRAVVAFLLHDGARRGLFANAFDGSAWQAEATNLDDKGLLNDNDVSTLVAPGVALDPLGNATVTWTQRIGAESVDSLYLARYTSSNGAWSNATSGVLEGGATSVDTHQIAFDANGNGLVVFRAGSTLYAKAYTRNSNSWGAATTLSTTATGTPSLSMSSNGNGVATWIQSGSVYGRIFTGGAWAGTSPQLLESWSGTAVNPVGAINNSGQATVVFIQASGAVNNVYAARFKSTGSSGASVIEGNSNTVVAEGNLPSVAINADGTVITTWLQKTGTQTTESVYSVRYNANATPYYTLPSGGDWASVANTLYGTAGLADQLSAGRSYVAGMRISGMASSLVHTLNTVVPAYYSVQAGDTWAAITQEVYGTSDPAAVSALRSRLGDPALTAGLHLTMPPGFTYTRQSATGLRMRATDSLNFETTYTSDEHGRISAIEAPEVGGVRQKRRFSYNERGDLTGYIDAMGKAVTMSYDGHGNQILQRDAAGNTISRHYDSRNQLVSETTYLSPDPDDALSGQPARPLTSRYVYDIGGRNLLRFSVSAEGRVTEHVYNGFGERVSTIEYAGARYETASLGIADVPSEAQLAAWVEGQDRTRTRRVDMAYDFRGQLQSSTSYQSVDVSGAGVTGSGAFTTFYVYDQAGQLLQRLTPSDGGSTAFAYDGLGRVLLTTTALEDGQSVTVTRYDDAHNQTVLTSANGLSTTSSFDAAGRLVSVLQSTAEAADLGETRYFYDDDNRLVMTQDPTGARKWTLYDAAGRMNAAIDADGSVTEFVYNANNQVTQTIAYATAIDTGMLVDASGTPSNLGMTALRPLLSGAAGLQDRKSWAAYDDAGRLVRTVDSAGMVTDIKYDGASRIVENRVHEQNVVVTSLGSTLEGLHVDTADGDRVTRNFHDADGLLLGQLDGENYYTAHTYDGAGRLVASTRYAERMQGSLGSDGAPPAVLAHGAPVPATAHVTVGSDEIYSAAGRDQTTYFFYNAGGQLAAQVDAENYLTRNVHDAKGNLTSSVRHAIALNVPVTVQTRLADLVPTEDPQDQKTTWVYDRLNRVTREINSQGTLTDFVYDLSGQLVSTTRAVGQVDARSAKSRFDVQGRLVAELSGEAAAMLAPGLDPQEVEAIWAGYAIRHAYDHAGRRISTTDALGNQTLFFYNDDGLLTHTVNALGEVDERGYDAFNQLHETRRYATRIDTEGLEGGQVTPAFAGLLSAVRNAAADSRTVTDHDQAGRVSRLTDSEGFSTSYTYTAFGELFGTIRHFSAGFSAGEQREYDRRGLQTSLIRNAFDASSPIDRWVYDAFGRLVSSTTGAETSFAPNPNANTQLRHYDRLGRVIQTIESSNGAVRLNAYDAFGRVYSSTDALNQTTTYRYDQSERKTTVTSPEGISLVTVHTRHGETYSVSVNDDPPTVYDYDRDGNLLETSTPLTHSKRSYDRAHRLESTTDANGNLVHYTYDQASRVLSVTVDPAGLALTTRYRYDAKGQSTWVQSPNGTWTRTEYDLNGRVKAVTVDPRRGPDAVAGAPDDHPSGLALRTAYEYDERGSVVTLTDPRGTVTTYSYDALGRRIKEQVDPAGLNLTRTYGYDLKDNLVSTTEGSGLSRTLYVLDAQDRVHATLVVASRNGAADVQANVEIAEYDLEGRVIRSVKLANPVQIADLLGAAGQGGLRWADIEDRLVFDPARDAVMVSRYDADGRLRFTVDGQGSVVERVYDTRGNVVDEISYSTPLTDLSTLDSPDWMPQPVADINSDQRVHRSYDALNRVVTVENAEGALTRFAYDGNGNVIEKFSYASFYQVADPDRDLHERYAYDAANRLEYAIDGVGAITRREYDANGNVIRRRAYAQPAVAALASPKAWRSYLKKGVAESTQDRLSHQFYDAANRLSVSVDATGAVSQFVHDDIGNIVRTTTFALPVSEGMPLDIELPTRLAQPSADRTTHAVYDSANRRIFSVDAGGAVSRDTYDAVGNSVETTRYGRLVQVPLGEVATAAGILAQLDSTDTPDGIPSPADRRSLRVFDAARRLTGTVDALGYVLHNTYDGLGQLTSSTAYATPITPGADPADWRQAVADRAASYDPQADRRSRFAYDAAGRLSSSWDALGQEEQFTYNALGQKTSFTNKLGAVWTYAYDRAGRLRQEVSPEVDVTALRQPGPYEVQVPGYGEFYTDTYPVITSLAYDAFGNVTERTISTYQEGGQEVTRRTMYRYDAVGRQTHTYFPGVAVYDRSSDPLSSRRMSADVRLGSYGQDSVLLASPRYEVELGEVLTETVYNVFGDAVANQDVAGNWSYKVYDDSGRVAYGVDAEGYVTGYTRNAFGDVEHLTRFAAKTQLFSAGRSELRASDIEDALYASGDADERRVITEFDRMGRAQRVYENVGFVYDSSAAQYDTEDSAWKQTASVYNAFGEKVRESRLANEREGRWVHTTHYFDLLGREIATVDGLGYLTERSYDAAGNVELVSEFANAASQSGLNDWVRGAVDSTDRAVRTTYDLLNRKLSETQLGADFFVDNEAERAQGIVTRYTYDRLGNLVSTTDAEGLVTFSYYDVLGRVKAVVGPSGSGAPGTARQSLTEFLRDLHGNVVVTIQHQGGVTADAGHYEIPEDDSGTSRYTFNRYDGLGRLIETRDPTGSARYTSYDVAGNVAKEWQDVSDESGATGRTSYKVFEYDRLGHQIRVIEPSADRALVPGIAGTIASSGVAWPGGRATALRWNGNNVVTLAWSDLVVPDPVAPDAQNVSVTLTYRTRGIPNHTVPVTFRDDTTKTLPARKFSARESAGGVTMDWHDDGDNVNGGISAILSVKVVQLIDGVEVVLHDGPLRESEIDEPTMLPLQDPLSMKGSKLFWSPLTGHSQFMRMRLVGQADWRDVSSLIVDEGEHHTMDTSAWLSREYSPAEEVLEEYEYEFTQVRSDGQGPTFGLSGVVTYSGQAAVYEPPRLPPLTGGVAVVSGGAAGEPVVLQWAAPEGARSTLRYRRLENQDWMSGLEWVAAADGETMQYDFGQLAAGQYVVSLLLDGYPWMGAYDGSDQASALGVLTITADGAVFDDLTEPYYPGYYHERAYTYTERRNVPVSAVAGALEQHYNAFGEIVSRGRIGADGLYRQEEYMRYDKAGRLWRTNQGDGIDKVMLHDLLDRVTAEIRTGVGADNEVLREQIMGSAQKAHWAHGVQRTDIQYDALGRATATVMPERSTVGLAGGAEVAETARVKLSSVVSSTFTPNPNDPYREPGEPLGPHTWSGLNRVSIDWSDLRTYGNGDVRVTLKYATVAVPGVVGSRTMSRTSLLSPGNTGVSFSWTDVAAEGGIGQILEVRVEKFDIHGTAHLVYQLAGGTIQQDGQRIVIPRASDQTDHTGYTPDGLGEVRVAMRPVGHTEWSTLGSDEAVDFGSAIVVDAANLSPGEYDYEVSYAGSRDSGAVKSAGRIVIGSSPSATPLLQRPRAERAQVVRTYDRWGNTLSATDPRSLNWVTRYSYDWGNRLVAQVAPPADGGSAASGPSRSSRYDRLGRLVTSTDARGAVTRLRYDLAGFVASTQIDGKVTESSRFNTFGERVESTDGNGLVTFYRYDKAGRLLDKRTQAEISRGAAAQETYAYDEMGRRVAVTNREGETTHYAYDARGNVIAVTHIKGGARAVTQRTVYDANNRKTAEIDGNGFSRTWTYDYFGRLTAHQDVGGAVYGYVYDGRGQLIEQKNSRGQHLKYSYDGQGQMVWIEDAALHQTSRFDYDLAGNRLSEVVWQADPGTPTLGHIYQSNLLAYDAAGRLRLVTGLNGARVEYEYDANGNRIHQWGRYHKGLAANGTVQLSEFDYWSAYDEQNRQVIAEGVRTNEAPRAWNPASPGSAPVIATTYGNLSITSKQGHYIQYDGNGNRALDVSYGRNVVKHPPSGFLLYNIDTSEGGSSKVYEKAYNTEGWEIGPRVFQLHELLSENGWYYVEALDWSGSGEDVGNHHRYFQGYEYQYPTGTDNPFSGQDGYVAESYEYDDHQRISKVRRGTVVIDQREYDGAGRLRSSGPAEGDGRDVRYWAAMGKPKGGASSSHDYDAQGRVSRVTTRQLDDPALEFDEAWSTQTYNYDGAGNMVGMGTESYQDSNGQSQYFTYALKRFDGYQQASVTGHGIGGTGVTINRYDVNGRLVGVSDSSMPANDRSFINDAQGLVLQSTQGTNVLRQLIVGGQVLGRYGMGIDEADPRDSNGEPRFTSVSDFDSNFRGISGSYPSASSGSYQVQAGETLQSIAQAAYGDRRLWWRIAEANGLRGNDDLRAGQTLNIPGVASSANAADTYRPYDPAAMIGDTNPALPPPGDKGCGVVGMIIVIIVVVVVTILTAGAAAPAGSTVGGSVWGAGVSVFTSGAAASTATLGAAAFGGAVGALAGQVAANFMGMQDGLDWKGIALGAFGSALGVGLAGAMGGGTATGMSMYMNAAARAAVANAMTQCVAVAIHAQEDFSWKGVAAAAAGAAVGSAVGDQLSANSAFGKAIQDALGNGTAVQMMKATLTGFAAGMTTAAVKGGRVSTAQVATDAFGNALGNALGESLADDTGGDPGWLGAGTDVRHPYVDANGDLLTFAPLGPSPRYPDFSGLATSDPGADADARRAYWDEAFRNGIQIADASDSKKYVDGRLNSGAGWGGVHPPNAAEVRAARNNDFSYAGQGTVGDVAEGVPAPFTFRSAPEFRDLGRSVLNGVVGLADFALQVGRGTLRLYDRNSDGSPNVASLTAPVLDGWRLNYESEAYRNGLGLFGEMVSGMLAPAGFARLRSFRLGSTSVDVLGSLTSNQLTALRGAGLGDAEIASQISILGDVQLFRGTTPGFPGNPVLQQLGITPASTDPLVATVFALEGKAIGGDAVVLTGAMRRFASGDIEFGNVRSILEREVQVNVRPSQFEAQASYAIPVDTARKVLGDMGLVNLPPSIKSSEKATEILKSTKRLTPAQIQEFLERSGVVK